MTLQPLPSGFPYILYEEILFCFLSVRIRPNQLYEQYFQLSIQLSKYISQSTVCFHPKWKIGSAVRRSCETWPFQTGIASVNFSTDRFFADFPRYLRNFATILYERNFAEFFVLTIANKSVEFCLKTAGKMWTSHHSLHSWLSEPPASQQRMISSVERFLCIFCIFSLCFFILAWTKYSAYIMFFFFPRILFYNLFAFTFW